MSSRHKITRPCIPVAKSLRTASARRAMHLAISIVALTIFCLCSADISFATTYTTESCPASGNLPPGGSATTNLVISTECHVVGKQRAIGVYVYHNVNIIAGGTLSFEDTRIDFHAESIIVENGGMLEAGTVEHPIGRNARIPDEFGARIRIYLWGPAIDPDGGALCKQDNCGVPGDLWSSNTTMAMHDVPSPKNTSCVKASQINPNYKLPGDDCFYQYDVFDTNDVKGAYFGHKVLALSYGGKIQFLGKKGATYDVNVDKDPSNTGASWVRLAGVGSDKKTLTLSKAMPTWEDGDHIVVTTTDYLPTHNEEHCIHDLQNNGLTVVLGDCPAGQPPLPTELQNQHNATEYSLPSNMPASIGPSPIPSGESAEFVPRGELTEVFPHGESAQHRESPEVIRRGESARVVGPARTIETRAAVGLLTRDIEILSDPDAPDTDTSEHDHFPVAKGYFGGHTVVRQGFSQYQVKGVEFYHLGQGGVIGHYPVHFHMDRITSDNDTNPVDAPYIRDSSIHDSMTRWITVHATQGMIVQRNVGYQSIGHGFYLEDATEINNKIYGNLGAGVIAAVTYPVQPGKETLNPRNVPGILFRPNDGAVADPFPFRSDWDHPTAFWIMNGWNDFQYNMAAGVTSCGACYWLLPSAVGGPSMFEVWDGYASQQLDLGNDGTNNIGRAGLAPLKNFVGNSCVASMFSFITVGSTYPCLGFSDGTVANQTTLVAVPNTLAPAKGAANADVYYPQITGLRNPSKCPGNGDPGSGDCSTQAPCANSDVDAGKNCMVTSLDRYVTSFNYAQTNFAAIWMRAKWFLFTDGAVTDTQYGGLNFTTGGGYTRSDNPYGNWMLAYRSVFIGSSQPLGSNGMPANAFASNAGPFNPTSGLKCSNTSNNSYCLSTADGISMQINPFPGERLFTVYDGPAFQESNAYLDVYPTLLTGGSGKGWMYLDRAASGVRKNTSGQCYLPNAAIAWKQPNGFYYPPAFHSQNLMFANSKPAPGLIRHFLIEPTFPPLDKPGLHPPNQAIVTDYCPGADSPGMFNNFTDIDRQTVLNDGVPDVGNTPGGDGSLTGLIGTQISLPPSNGRETISVNDDPFFNAPEERTECASDMHPSSDNGRAKTPGTAKTSPYEYVTTGLIPACAIGYYTQTVPCPPPDQNLQCPVPKECNAGGVATGVAYWTHANANPWSFGVPLYREYLTEKEDGQNPKPKPFIQMMGQSTGQRSTLTLNHGRYYIDTSNNCAVQNPGKNPPGSNNPPGCLPYLVNGKPQVDVGVSVFQPGQTYYVYFVYGRASTYLTFDIYLGPNDETNKWTVNPVRGVFNGEPYVFNPVSGEPAWLLPPTYDRSTNLLTVKVDLSKSTIVQDFSNEFAKSCQPATYCGVKQVGSKQVCGCNKATCTEAENVACSWGPKDPDCPDAGCYGFSFTMPDDWPGPPAEHVNPPEGVLFSTGDPYFSLNYNGTNKPNVNFGAVDPAKWGQGTQCDYRQPGH